MLEKRFDRVEYVQFDESRHPLERYRQDFIGIFTLEDIKGARPAS
ncbi:hypothetical protein JCM19233_5559 [Vibrio astriarenae]|nr:hypothetical protein JCM19233_5559 [Vibrio sp. C7]